MSILEVLVREGSELLGVHIAEIASQIHDLMVADQGVDISAGCPRLLLQLHQEINHPLGMRSQMHDVTGLNQVSGSSRPIGLTIDQSSRLENRHEAPIIPVDAPNGDDPVYTCPDILDFLFYGLLGIRQAHAKTRDQECTDPLATRRHLSQIGPSHSDSRSVSPREQKRENVSGLRLYVNKSLVSATAEVMIPRSQGYRSRTTKTERNSRSYTSLTSPSSNDNPKRSFKEVTGQSGIPQGRISSK